MCWGGGKGYVVPPLKLLGGLAPLSPPAPAPLPTPMDDQLGLLLQRKTDLVEKYIYVVVPLHLNQYNENTSTKSIKFKQLSLQIGI